MLHMLPAKLQHQNTAQTNFRQQSSSTATMQSSQLLSVLFAAVVTAQSPVVWLFAPRG